MKKYWLLLVLLVSFSLPSGLYADVILTDDQAMELDQTLDELETTLKLQDKTLTEQQMTIDEQEKTINELNSLYKRQRASSVLHSVLTAIVSCLVGIGIGLFL